MGVNDIERFKAVADQDETHRMARSEKVEEREEAAKQLWNNFADILDKKQALDDLHRLTKEEIWEVRIFANHSSGKVSVFRAGEAKSDEQFRKEFEKALGFFEKASEEVMHPNLSQFCLPFYRSFYTITFRKSDVTKYLVDCRDTFWFCSVDSFRDSEHHSRYGK